MADIVGRLRKHARDSYYGPVELVGEAADEIELLRQTLEEVRTNGEHIGRDWLISEEVYELVKGAVQ